jgi:hypothetical protein
MSRSEGFPSPESARKILEISTKKASSNLGLSFILAFAHIKFDVNKAEFFIANQEELMAIYLKENKGFSEKDFLDLIAQFNEESQAFLENAFESSKDDDLAINQCKIYQSEKPRQNIVDKVFFHHSAYRSCGSEGAETLATSFGILLAQVLIDAVVLNMLNQAKINPNLYQTLQPKLSLTEGYGGYLRDDFMVLAKQLFNPQDSAICVRKHSKLHRVMAAKNDMESAGFAFQDLPFHLEGGNFIDCEVDGKKVALLAISDSLFSEKGEFLGSYFFESDGTKIEFATYKKFCQRVENFFKQIGYDEVVIIDRTFDEAIWRDDEKANIDALYHLDTFFGVAGDVAFIPEEPLITEESRQKLQAIFGDRIILMNAQDRVNLASNFITIGNNILFTTPDICQETIKKFNDFGFNCMVPPMLLSIMGTDGIRCRTQEVPQTIVGGVAAQKQKKEKVAAASNDY